MEYTTKVTVRRLAELQTLTASSQYSIAANIKAAELILVTLGASFIEASGAVLTAADGIIHLRPKAHLAASYEHGRAALRLAVAAIFSLPALVKPTWAEKVFQRLKLSVPSRGFKLTKNQLLLLATAAAAALAVRYVWSINSAGKPRIGTIRNVCGVFFAVFCARAFCAWAFRRKPVELLTDFSLPFYRKPNLMERYIDHCEQPDVVAPIKRLQESQPGFEQSESAARKGDRLAYLELALYCLTTSRPGGYGFNSGRRERVALRLAAPISLGTLFDNPMDNTVQEYTLRQDTIPLFTRVAIASAQGSPTALYYLGCIYSGTLHSSDCSQYEKHLDDGMVQVPVKQNLFFAKVIFEFLLEQSKKNTDQGKRTIQHLEGIERRLKQLSASSDSQKK